ncbi:MAG: YeeE/YedE family protein [Chitinophagales bacterium]|nr:YeeE/YedE family protein [Chitinophagales bacterium]
MSFYNTLPWYVAGPCITLVMFLLLYLGKRFGLSSSLKTTCSALGAGKKWSFFDYDWKADIWNLVFIAGTMVGGFIAYHFFMPEKAIVLSQNTNEALSQLGISNNEKYLPDFLLLKNISIKTIIILLGGGFLIGFGTRWANGCTSGHAISGLSNLQLPSLIAVIGFFIGGLLMTHFLLPLIF